MIASLMTARDIWIRLLLVAALATLCVMPFAATRVSAATIVTYQQTPGMSVSDVFSISVNGQSSPAYKAVGSPTSTFTTFTTDGAVTVDVQDLKGSVSSAVVRPLSYGIVPTIKNGNTVEFTMNPYQKVSVEVNGDYTNNVALVFADPPETNVPTGSNVVAYTTPGVYDLGSNPWCFPSGKDTLYIAGGVYLKGVIACNNVSHVNILGRGIFSGEGHTAPTTYHSYVDIDNSRYVTIDGVSLINPSSDPGGNAFGLTLWYSSNDTVNDVALINHPGTLNDTGLHEIGSNSIASNDLAISGDDDVIIADSSNNSTFKNLVLWTTAGDAIEFGWNVGGYGDTVDGADIIHFTGGNYYAQAAIGAIAYCQAATNPIHDVTVENVRVEGTVNRLIGLAAQNGGFCPVTTTAAAIYNITFRNITAEQNGANANVILGSNSNASVHDVNLENVTIGGQAIDSASAGSFTLGPYASNIQFSSTGNLLANGGFEFGYSPWFSNATLAVDTSTAHSGASSIKVTSRSSQYIGPMQDVTTLLLTKGMGAYKLAGAFKLANGSDNGVPTLKVNDSTGAHYYYTRCAVNSSAWTVCSGNQSVSWTGALSSAVFYLQTDYSSGDLWVDDASLTPVNLVANGGFETAALQPWFSTGSALSVDSSTASSGTYSVKATNRANQYQGPVQYVTHQLLAAGQRSYTIAAAMKMVSGSDTGRPTLQIYDDAGTHYYYSPCMINSSSWTTCSSTQNVTWTGTLKQAKFYDQTDSTSTPIWVDDAVVQ